MPMAYYPCTASPCTSGNPNLISPLRLDVDRLTPWHNKDIFFIVDVTKVETSFVILLQSVYFQLTFMKIVLTK